MKIRPGKGWAWSWEPICKKKRRLVNWVYRSKDDLKLSLEPTLPNLKPVPVAIVPMQQYRADMTELKALREGRPLEKCESCGKREATHFEVYDDVGLCEKCAKAVMTERKKGARNG